VQCQHEQDIVDPPAVIKLFQVDILVLVIAVIISLLFIDMQIEVTQGMTNWMNNIYKLDEPGITAAEMPNARNMLMIQFGVNITFVILAIMAWRRRIALQRG
jgi:hypothetical protein